VPQAAIKVTAKANKSIARFIRRPSPIEKT